MQKLLADLGVNAILIITLSKHCSYIDNLDSYCFKIGTLNSPKGGKKFSRGGGGGNALKETLCIIEYGSTLYVGMTQKKNGGSINRVQNLMFRTLLWM